MQLRHGPVGKTAAARQQDVQWGDQRQRRSTPALFLRKSRYLCLRRRSFGVAAIDQVEAEFQALWSPLSNAQKGQASANGSDPVSAMPAGENFVLVMPTKQTSFACSTPCRNTCGGCWRWRRNSWRHGNYTSIRALGWAPKRIHTANPPSSMTVLRAGIP